MKRTIAILSLLCIVVTAMAQGDVALRVKKMPALRISPDSMYFDSHTARRFMIRDIPPGCKLSVDFTGGDLVIFGTAILLTPFHVYRDSDVVKLNSKNLNGFKSTKNDFYTGDVTIMAIDAKGDTKARLTRKCYIKPEKKPRNVPMTSKAFDAPLLPLLDGLYNDTLSKPASK